MGYRVNLVDFETVQTTDDEQIADSYFLKKSTVTWVGGLKDCHKNSNKVLVDITKTEEGYRVFNVKQVLWWYWRED